MSGEPIAGMPISSPGSESRNQAPELTAASEELDAAIAAFSVAAEKFTTAGGDPMVVLQRFQSAVMGG